MFSLSLIPYVMRVKFGGVGFETRVNHSPKEPKRCTVESTPSTSHAAVCNSARSREPVLISPLHEICCFSAIIQRVKQVVNGQWEHSAN